MHKITGLGSGLGQAPDPEGVQVGVKTASELWAAPSSWMEPGMMMMGTLVDRRPRLCLCRPGSLRCPGLQNSVCSVLSGQGPAIRRRGVARTGGAPGVLWGQVWLFYDL